MIENEKISYDDQFRTSIKVTMEPNKKEVRTSWENWLEDKYDTKVHGANWLSKKDVLSAERIKIPIISDQQFDLYAKVVDKGQGSHLVFLHLLVTMCTLLRKHSQKNTRHWKI
jgi:hypothetical protein